MDNLQSRIISLLRKAEAANGAKVKISDLNFEELNTVIDLLQDGSLAGTVCPSNQHAVVRLTPRGMEYLQRFSSSQRPVFWRIWEFCISNFWKLLVGIAALWAGYFLGPDLEILNLFGNHEH